MAGTTFRTRLSLRVAVAAAGALWASTLVFLAQFPEVAPRTLLSAAGFAALFAVFSARYERLAITITREGIDFRSLGKRLGVRFDEIVGIEVRRSVAGRSYEIRTPRGRLRFSSLVARDRELFELLRQGAGLQRRS
jgi:hypothetical protein